MSWEEYAAGNDSNVELVEQILASAADRLCTTVADLWRGLYEMLENTAGVQGHPGRHVAATVGEYIVKAYRDLG